MEDKEKKEFIDGFNKGYLIQKYEPELHEQIADSLKNQAESHPLVHGMAKGAEEARLEKAQDELNSFRKEQGNDLDIDL